MATTTEYTKEQLNYYRICYVATDILPESLRSIFKQEWDNRYTATMGEWRDEPRNGMDFYNAKSPRNQRRNAINGIVLCFFTPFFSLIVLATTARTL